MTRYVIFYTRRFHVVSEKIYVLSRTRNRYQQKYQLRCEHQRILLMMLALLTFIQQGASCDLSVSREFCCEDHLSPNYCEWGYTHSSCHIMYLVSGTRGCFPLDTDYI